jgi:predicted nucleotidyltransferase
MDYSSTVEVSPVRRDDVLTLLAAHRGEIESFGVESLRLFGSVARGEASTDSDVDLLVSFRQTPTFSGYMKLRIFLEDLLGARVDLITESGLREGVRPFVEKDAIRVA